MSQYFLNNEPAAKPLFLQFPDFLSLISNRGCLKVPL